MAVHLKRLSEQVIVITGASSGIGLETAKQAVSRGAKVLLASRNHDALEEICRELNTSGPGRAVCTACDVGDPDAVQVVADRAMSEFGRIDTWVNNAGVSIYGKLWEVPLEDKRRMFETNFWGVVYGCRSAVKAMRESGGAIINIGSVLSERAIPIQGMYTASKHAVKAYTDSLRMEVEAEGFPISVSLVKPAAINTPYTEHAMNYMDHHPTHTPPVYDPQIVAKAILECAEHPRRDIFVGGSSKIFQMMETFLPRLTDLVMERGMMDSGQSSAKLDSIPQETSLYGAPAEEGEVRGQYPGHVMKTSLATTAALHPVATGLIAASLGLLAAAGVGYVLSDRMAVRANKREQPRMNGRNLTH